MEKEQIPEGEETLMKGDGKEGNKRQTQSGECMNIISLIVCNQ